jgi:hypothetical protein
VEIEIPYRGETRPSPGWTSVAEGPFALGEQRAAAGRSSRSTPKPTKWNPATAPRAPRHSGRSGRPKYIEMGHDERMEGSPSKLIFFLTILDSHALNGPVATHVQLVNRMLAECLRSASGSNRSAAAASRTNARCRGGEPCSEDLSVTVRERESQRQKGRTGSRDAHRPPYFE